MSKKINQGLSINRTPSYKCKSLISVVTLVAFITTTIWTPGVSFAMTSLPAPEVSLPYQATLDSTVKFFIPKDLGKIESLDLGQGPGIVHIQTAHGHYDAQQKIRKILHHLDKNYGIHTLLVEGSAFKLRPEILNFFPEDPKRTMKVADQLARNALVKGPELYLLDQIGTTEAGDRVLPLAEAYGIEDAKTYRENGEAFVRVLTQKQKTEQFLRDMDEGITRLSAPHLSDPLRRFIRTQESFEKRLMSVDAWFSYLKDESQKNLLLDLDHPANQVEWPMTVRLFKIRELQKNLDLQQFEKEREKFLKAIKRFIPEEGRAPAARQESVRPVSFFAQIGELLQLDRMGQQLPDPETSLLFESMVRRLPSNFNYHLYPNVRYFIGILLLTSELKADRLMDESSKIAELITSRLARADSEKAIVALLKDYRLLQKLFALELLPEDYETILASAEPVRSSLQNGQNVLSPSSIVNRLESLAGQTPGAGRAGKVQFSHLDELDGLFDSAMQFYAGVKARDLAMIDMVEKRLKETGVGKVAVVTGGFHARPFRDHFASQGYTYALVTPKITGQDEAGHRHYIENTLQMTQAGEELTSNHQVTNREASHSALHARTSTRETVSLMHTRQELIDMGADVAALARMAYRVTHPVAVDNPQAAEALAKVLKNRSEVRLTKQVADEVSGQVGSSQRVLENIRRAQTFSELRLDVQNAFWEVFQNTRLIPDEVLLDDWYAQNREAVIRALEDVALNLGAHILSEPLTETGATPELWKSVQESISTLSQEQVRLREERNLLWKQYAGLRIDQIGKVMVRLTAIETSLVKGLLKLQELYMQLRHLSGNYIAKDGEPRPTVQSWSEVDLAQYKYLESGTLISLFKDFSGKEFQTWVQSAERHLKTGQSLNEIERKIAIYIFMGFGLVNGDSREDLAKVALASRSESRQDRPLPPLRSSRENARLQQDLDEFLTKVAIKFVVAAILGVFAYFCFLSNARRIAEKEAGMTPVEPAPIVVNQPGPRSELRADSNFETTYRGTLSLSELNGLILAEVKGLPEPERGFTEAVWRRFYENYNNQGITNLKIDRLAPELIVAILESQQVLRRVEVDAMLAGFVALLGIMSFVFSLNLPDGPGMWILPAVSLLGFFAGFFRLAGSVFRKLPQYEQFDAGYDGLLQAFVAVHGRLTQEMSPVNATFRTRSEIRAAGQSGERTDDGFLRLSGTQDGNQTIELGGITFYVPSDVSYEVIDGKTANLKRGDRALRVQVVSHHERNYVKIGNATYRLIEDEDGRYAGDITRLNPLGNDEWVQFMGAESLAFDLSLFEFVLPIDVDLQQKLRPGFYLVPVNKKQRPALAAADYSAEVVRNAVDRIRDFALDAWIQRNHDALNENIGSLLHSIAVMGLSGRDPYYYDAQDILNHLLQTEHLAAHREIMLALQNHLYFSFVGLHWSKWRGMRRERKNLSADRGLPASGRNKTLFEQAPQEGRLPVKNPSDYEIVGIRVLGDSDVKGISPNSEDAVNVQGQKSIDQGRVAAIPMMGGSATKVKAVLGKNKLVHPALKVRTNKGEEKWISIAQGRVGLLLGQNPKVRIVIPTSVDSTLFGDSDRTIQESLREHFPDQMASGQIRTARQRAGLILDEAGNPIRYSDGRLAFVAENHLWAFMTMLYDKELVLDLLRNTDGIVVIGNGDNIYNYPRAGMVGEILQARRDGRPLATVAAVTPSRGDRKGGILVETTYQNRKDPAKKIVNREFREISEFPTRAESTQGFSGIAINREADPDFYQQMDTKKWFIEDLCAGKAIAFNVAFYAVDLKLILARIFELDEKDPQLIAQLQSVQSQRWANIVELFGERVPRTIQNKKKAPQEMLAGGDPAKLETPTGYASEQAIQDFIVNGLGILAGEGTSGAVSSEFLAVPRAGLFAPYKGDNQDVLDGNADSVTVDPITGETLPIDPKTQRPRQKYDLIANQAVYRDGIAELLRKGHKLILGDGEWVTEIIPITYDELLEINGVKSGQSTPVAPRSEARADGDQGNQSVRELNRLVQERISKLQAEAFQLEAERDLLETYVEGFSPEKMAAKEKRLLEIERSLGEIRVFLRELHERSRELRAIQDTQAWDSLHEVLDWKHVRLADYEYLADETLVSLLQDFSGKDFQKWVESLEHLLESGKSMNETERKIGIYVSEGFYLSNGDDMDDLARVALASRSELRAGKTASTQEQAEKVVGNSALALSMDPVLLKQIIKHERVIHVTIPVQMDDGSIRNFHGFRVQHNSARGPYKGGIRMSDQHDEEGTLEEAKGLATWMSVKTGVVGIPLGGGKGDILASRGSLSEVEQARLVRGYVRTIMEQEGIDVFGPFSDIPAPDMNTDGKMMAWFADEYIKIMAEQEKVFDERILASLRKFIGNMKEADPVKLDVLREYIRLAQDETIAGYRFDTIELATVTGKPAGKSPEGDSMIFPTDSTNPYLGGSQGREKATGQGGFFALERVLHHQGKSSVKGMSYALQGFGNVAGFFARIANRSGMVAKAIQSAYPAGKDETGKTRFAQFTIYNEDGIDIASLDQWILGEAKRLGKKPGEFSLENFPGARVIANEDFWKLDVDVVVPAATNNVITEKNAGSIRAPVVLELANGPTSVEGDKMLFSRGKLVIPDVLANAGGVIVSYFEMIQNYTHDRWTTAMVDRMLSERMSQATDDAMRIMNSYRKTFRQAVYMSALMKIADAQIARDPELNARYADGAIQPYDSQGLSRRPETTSHLNVLTQNGQLATLLAETAREFNAEIAARVDRISGRFSKGIARNPVVLITGPESSGKAVVAESIVKELQRREDFKKSGRKVHFVDYDHVKPEEFEQLLSGQRTQLLQPRYTFYGVPVWTPITVNRGDMIVVEGRTAFSVANLKSKDQGAELYFGKEDVYKIFINVSPSFNLTVSKPDQVFVPKGMPLTSFHLRFIREILDRQNRRGETMNGAGIVGLLEGWHGLKEMQNRTVYPQWPAADETINMYFPEEIAIIRNQALRLLVLALRHAQQELPGSQMLVRQLESTIAFLREVNPINPEELPEDHPVRQWAINHQATTSRAEVRMFSDTETLVSLVDKIAGELQNGEALPLAVRSILWDVKRAVGKGDFPAAITALNTVNFIWLGAANFQTRQMIAQLRDVLSQQVARSENRSRNGEDETVEGEGRWRGIFESAFYVGTLAMTVSTPILLFMYAVGHWADQMEGFTAVPFFLTIGGTTVILMGIGAGIFKGLLFVGKIFFGFPLFDEMRLRDTDVPQRVSPEAEIDNPEDSVSKKRSESRSASFLVEETPILSTQQVFQPGERWDLKQVINLSMLTLIREFYYGIIPERVREGIETSLNNAGQALRAMMADVGVSPADATGLSPSYRKKIFKEALGILGIRELSVDAIDVFVLGTELLERLQENDGRGLVAFREVLRGSLVAAVTDPETLASINQILEENGLEPYLTTQELKNRRLPKGAVVRAVLLAGETLSEEDNRLLRIAERNIIRMTQGMLDRFMLAMEQIVTAMMGEKAIGRSA